MTSRSKITLTFEPVARFLAACGLVLGSASASMSQVERYEPSRPTVSPYLELFRDDDQNRALPNYHTFVRPLQQQYRVNQMQQRRLQQQSQAIQQLQSNVQSLQQPQAVGTLVAPTGKSSWFMRPGGRATFLNTSRFYSQAGTAQRAGTGPRR